MVIKLEKFVARYGEKSLDSSNMHIVEMSTFVIFSPSLTVHPTHPVQSLPPTSYAGWIVHSSCQLRLSFLRPGTI